MSMVGALTRTQKVHGLIRNEILNGERPAGSALRTQELATQFQVSMSVVREALVRLSSEHLVRQLPNQGFRVVEISPEDLWDLVGTRIEIESIGLRRSIELGEVNWEASVLSTHHVLEGTPIRDLDGPRTSVAWDRAHEAFHDALIGACGLSRLTAFARTLRDSSELYRQISGAHQDGDRDVLGEHRELMQLSTDRKADAAVEALARHLRLTAELALKNV